MNFSTGNSGNTLFEAVVKIGNECAQEGAFCTFLGAKVAPRIHAILPNGYVMEHLEPAPRKKDLLVRIEKLLEEHVWCRPALPVSNEIDWKCRLAAYGIEIPDWIDSETSCLVHGDPTASNALLRGKDLVLCDPRPPRDYMPQYKETDMGRIIQSMFGWEVAAYNAPVVDFDVPYFWTVAESRKKAMFWVRAAAVRIAALENSRPKQRKAILDWCEKIKGMSRHE